MAAYNRQYMPTMPPAFGIPMRRNAGDVEFVKVLNDQPQRLEFLLRQEKSGNYLRGAIEIAGDPPIARVSGCNWCLLARHPRAVRRTLIRHRVPRARQAARIPLTSDPRTQSSRRCMRRSPGPPVNGATGSDFLAFRAGRPPYSDARTPDGKVSTLVESPDEYVAGVRGGMEANGFFEDETARSGHTFGPITEIFSTYESRRQASDAQPFARGINSIQLLNDGTRWWVVTVYWQAERPDLPIPRYTYEVE